MTEGGRYRGRPVSWVAVIIILAGFTLGGIALIVGRWWLFWVAVGVVVVGGILAVAIDIFADVELDHLHGDDGEPHISPIRHEVAGGSSELEPSEATTESAAGEGAAAPTAQTPAKDPAEA